MKRNKWTERSNCIKLSLKIKPKTFCVKCSNIHNTKKKKKKKRDNDINIKISLPTEIDILYVIYIHVNLYIWLQNKGLV